MNYYNKRIRDCVDDLNIFQELQSGRFASSHATLFQIKREKLLIMALADIRSKKWLIKKPSAGCV